MSRPTVAEPETLPTNRSQAMAWIPKDRHSFFVSKLEVLPLNADLVDFFVGPGVQIDLQTEPIREGYLSIWLILSDAVAFAARLTRITERMVRTRLQDSEE